MEGTNRLYTDLAWLWPLWGDPSGYAPYCENAARLIREHARREVLTLLNLGCGGGKNSFNLKQHFTVTGLDLSPAMLENARQLNPDCRFVQADMRTFALQERFDAILVDDAICYMTSESDLRPGGVMIVGPDVTTETFAQNHSQVTPASATNKPAGLEVVFVENDYDPDPQDTEYDALILYILRQDGQLRVEQDLHHLGLFSIQTWRDLLLEAGFEIREAAYSEDGRDFVEFVCIKPA